jgi:pimeloyl-ACP methyl ester carboxylesterase
VSAESPDTIVLIHGLWMTPRSWEEWVPYYEGKGYNVLTPGYPGFEIEVEALRENPSVIADLTVPQVVAHLAETITELDRPPIIMGHSFGGALTQLLLDRGCGAAGVAINGAPTEGVLVNPPSQIKSLFPILKNPARRNEAAGFTHDEFHYAFTNTLSEQESRTVYDRYHIPAPGRWIWAYGVIANFKPGHQETWVNYKNDSRAPLLFIGGSEDHIMPPSVQRSNAKHYKSNTITEFEEFEGRSHWTCGEPGWETVADRALEWAAARAVGAEVPAATAV